MVTARATGDFRWLPASNDIPDHMLLTINVFVNMHGLDSQQSPMDYQYHHLLYALDTIFIINKNIHNGKKIVYCVM